MRLNLIILTATILFISSCAQKGSERTDLITTDKRIFDGAELLTNEQEDSIFFLIKTLETEIGSQIAIITLDTLNGESINEFSLKMAEKLNLGRKDFDDGLLLTLSIGDKKIRIEVGYGLEKIIRDEIAARIIREDMAPRFKQKEYGQGFYNGVSRLKNLIEENKALVGRRL